MLQPELQDPAEFADAVDNIVATHVRVAESYPRSVLRSGCALAAVIAATGRGCMGESESSSSASSSSSAAGRGGGEEARHLQQQSCLHRAAPPSQLPALLLLRRGLLVQQQQQQRQQLQQRQLPQRSPVQLRASSRRSCASAATAQEGREEGRWCCS
jgi:hypothetical protein